MENVRRIILDLIDGGLIWAGAMVIIFGLIAFYINEDTKIELEKIKAGHVECPRMGTVDTSWRKSCE